MIIIITIHYFIVGSKVRLKIFHPLDLVSIFIFIFVYDNRHFQNMPKDIQAHASQDDLYVFKMFYCIHNNFSPDSVKIYLIYELQNFYFDLFGCSSITLKPFWDDKNKKLIIHALVEIPQIILFVYGDMPYSTRKLHFRAIDFKGTSKAMYQMLKHLPQFLNKAKRYLCKC